MNMRRIYINKVRAWSINMLPVVLLSLLPFFSACSHIDEDEQLIEMTDNTPTVPEEEQPSAAPRNVLIEDFTGQRCSNCPNGTLVIEDLQQTYEGRVIVVGLYSGPFGKTAAGALLPLTTETGCTYYDNWQVESQPGARIGRSGNVLYKTQDWVKAVQTQLGYLSEIEMAAEATVNGDAIDITVKEKAFGPVDGKLQVWLLEDGITAAQIMPDGSANRNYVHNHVFRTAVNGTWGDDFSIAADEEKTQTFSQPIDATWNTANLSVVAFVYNDDGVEQVVKEKVNK